MFKAIDITKSKATVVKDRQNLILKDMNGNIVNYRNSEFTNTSRSVLSSYNTFASTIKVEYADKGLKTTMDMHFKNSFDEYGRMYGASYQNMSKNNRADITIDGEECVEIDFSNLHFRMLLDMYLLEHHVSGVDDLYLLPLSDPQRTNPHNREMIKQSFNKFINSVSALKTRQAIQGEMNRYGNLSDFKSAIEVYKAMEVGYNFLFNNTAVMANIHNGKPLAAFLQRRESAMCLDIASTLAEEGIFVGTIHDSFLCKKKDYEVVSKLIGDTYREHMNVTRDIHVSVIYKGSKWKELI